MQAHQPQQPETTMSEINNVIVRDVGVHLTDIESFSCVFKSLWWDGVANDMNNNTSKLKMNLLDTILYRNGVAFRYLFTSSKTGEILKKKTEKLNNYDILKSLKLRAHGMKGKKEYAVLKPPIATVWYVAVDSPNGHQSIRCQSVNEQELSKLLEQSYLPNMLAIQVYVNGWPLRASGIFEHRVFVTEDYTAHDGETPKRQHETFEFLQPPDHMHLSTYSTGEGIRRLAVTEKQHGTLKTYAQRLMYVLEKQMWSTVASLVIQVAFDSSWVPYLVAAREVVLWDVPKRLLTPAGRLEMVFSDGIPPVPMPGTSSSVHRTDSGGGRSSGSGSGVGNDGGMGEGQGNHPAVTLSIPEQGGRSSSGGGGGGVNIGNSSSTRYGDPGSSASVRDKSRMTPYGQKMMAAWDKKQRSIAFSEAAQGARARSGEGDRDDGEMESKRYFNMLVSPLRFDADEAFRIPAQGLGLGPDTVETQGPGLEGIPLRTQISPSHGASNLTKTELGRATDVAIAPGPGLGPASLPTAENMSPMDPPVYTSSYLTYQQALDKSTAALASPSTAFPVGNDEEGEEKGRTSKVKGRDEGGHQLPVPASEWVVESERLTAADHMALDLLDRAAAIAQRQSLPKSHLRNQKNPTRTALTARQRSTEEMLPSHQRVYGVYEVGGETYAPEYPISSKGGKGKGRRPVSASAVPVRSSTISGNNNNSHNSSSGNFRGEIYRRSSRIDLTTTDDDDDNQQLSSPLPGRDAITAIYGDVNPVTATTTRRALNGPPTPKTSTIAPPPPVGPMIPIAPVVFASSFSPDARAVYKLDTEAETNKWRAAITAGSKGRLAATDTATAAQLDAWQNRLRSPPLLPTSPHPTHDHIGHDSPSNPSHTYNHHLRDVAFADAVKHYVPREQSPIPPHLALATRVADAAIVAAVKDITTNAVALLQTTTMTASRNAPTDSGDDEGRGDVNNGHDDFHTNSNHQDHQTFFDQPGVRPRVRLTHRPASAPHARATSSPARYNAAAMGTKVITDALDGTGGVEGYFPALRRAIAGKDPYAPPSKQLSFKTTASSFKSSLACSGDYCLLLKGVRARAKAANDAITYGAFLGLGSGMSSLKKTIEKNHTPTSSSSQTAKTNQLYQLPYKSVLLDRQEAAYLGTEISEDIRGALRRSLDVGLTDTYDGDRIVAAFARNQVQRVASKCREEVLQIEFATHTAMAWDDVKYLYHKLVLNPALESVKANRFYQTCPLCETCFKVYSFLDHQRTAVILSQGKDKGGEKQKDKGWEALSSSQWSRNGSRPASPLHQTNNNTYEGGGDYRYTPSNKRPASASGYHNNRNHNNNHSSYYDSHGYNGHITEPQQHSNPQLYHRSLVAPSASTPQTNAHRPQAPPPSSSSHVPGTELALVPDASSDRPVVPASAAVDHFLSRLSDNDMYLLQQGLAARERRPSVGVGVGTAPADHSSTSSSSQQQQYQQHLPYDPSYQDEDYNQREQYQHPHHDTQPSTRPRPSSANATATHPHPRSTTPTHNTPCVGARLLTARNTLRPRSAGSAMAAARRLTSDRPLFPPHLRSKTKQVDNAATQGPGPGRVSAVEISVRPKGAGIGRDSKGRFGQLNSWANFVEDDDYDGMGEDDGIMEDVDGDDMVERGTSRESGLGQGMGSGAEPMKFSYGKGASGSASGSGRPPVAPRATSHQQQQQQQYQLQQQQQYQYQQQQLQLFGDDDDDDDDGEPLEGSIDEDEDDAFAFTTLPFSAAPCFPLRAKRYQRGQSLGSISIGQGQGRAVGGTPPYPSYPYSSGIDDGGNDRSQRPPAATAVAAAASSSSRESSRQQQQQRQEQEQEQNDQSQSLSMSMSMQMSLHAPELQPQPLPMELPTMIDIEDNEGHPNNHTQQQQKQQEQQSTSLVSYDDDFEGGLSLMMVSPL